MKTKRATSILTVSLVFAVCGACGTPEELAATVASQERAPIRAEHALSAPTSAQKLHCVVAATAVPKDGTDSLAAGSTEPAPATCFETFAEAATFATRGRVALPADARPDDIQPALLLSAGLTGPYVIGIEYENRAFGGRSITFISYTTCAVGDLYTETMPVVPQPFWPWPLDWNDRISSAQAFSGCNHSYHFEHVNFGGAVTDCGTGCSDIGAALNDRTSSIMWTK
jgi:hypothetical protein